MRPDEMEGLLKMTDIDEVVADATTWRDAGVDLCIVGLPLHVKPEQLAPLAEALAPLA